MMRLFDLQGHRGARGLKPENSLPSFETAFDIGVSSVETDVHLTADGMVILVHDPFIGEKIYRRISADVPEPAETQLVSRLSLAQVRGYRGDKNPDPLRFPDQDAGKTPLANWFARSRDLDEYGIPTLADLLAFADAYGGEAGKRAGKTVPAGSVLTWKSSAFPFDPNGRTICWKGNWSKTCTAPG